ncbi:MAG: hypothetical protein AAF376_15790 [Pseudomonadota bacterium]
MIPTQFVYSALSVGILGLGFPVPGYAQDVLGPDEVAILPRLIDSICVDIVVELDGCEQIVLLASDTVPDRADLLILSDWRTEPASTPLLIARGAAFNGAMWDMAPSLDLTDDRSLVLGSQQTGTGRYPWFQNLTITHDAGRFLLTGFHYTTYDRTTGRGMRCNVNLSTGDFEVEGTLMNATTETTETAFTRSGRIEPAEVDAANIGTNAPFPAPCEEGLAALETF